MRSGSATRRRCPARLRRGARRARRSATASSVRAYAAGDRADVEEERDAAPAKRALVRILGGVRDLAKPLGDQAGVLEGAEIVLERPVRVEERHLQAVALDRELLLRPLEIGAPDHKRRVRLP